MFSIVRRGGFNKPISELSMANGGRAQPCQKWVTDDWSCNVETSSVKLSSGPRNQHLMTFSRVEIWPTSGVSDQQADLSKVGWVCSATDTGRRQWQDTLHNIRWRMVCVGFGWVKNNDLSKSALSNSQQLLKIK